MATEYAVQWQTVPNGPFDQMDTIDWATGKPYTLAQARRHPYMKANLPVKVRIVQRRVTPWNFNPYDQHAPEKERK